MAGHLKSSENTLKCGPNLKNILARPDLRRVTENAASQGKQIPKSHKSRIVKLKVTTYIDSQLNLLPFLTLSVFHFLNFPDMRP